MASTSEVGHAVNIANFSALISFVTSYGPAYATTNSTIKVLALNAALTAANSASTAVAAKLAAEKVAQNTREALFTPLQPLATRVTALFSATENIPANAVKDLKTINRKIQGRRATGGSVSGDITNPDGSITPGNSASQRSYDQQVAHMQNFLSLLTLHPSYAPTEPGFNVAALTSLVASFVAANTAVISAITATKNERINRNLKLYDPATGLLARAKTVKEYLKGAFGATNPMYKQVNALKFKQIKP